MADGDPTTFSERTARRVLRAMRKIEHLPTIEPDLSEPPREVGDVDTFVIASDPSDYSEPVDLLPLGYRGHVIAYRVPDEFDLKNLPVLPSLDTLLKKEAGKAGKKNVADWAEHSWIDTYEHPELGRPVLLNICRLTKGAFFRGQVVLAKYAGGFRHAGECRGSHFWYSAPTWGEWPTKAKAADHKYTVQPGWCVIDPGYTSLVVTLRGELDPAADPEYATADIKTAEDYQGGGKTIEMIPPDADEGDGPTIYVYGDTAAENATLATGSDCLVHWDHARFRFQVEFPLAGVEIEVATNVECVDDEIVVTYETIKVLEVVD